MILEQEKFNKEMQEMMKLMSSFESSLYDELIKECSKNDLNILLCAMYLSGKRIGLKIAGEILNGVKDDKANMY
jgi:hypothetical protein